MASFLRISGGIYIELVEMYIVEMVEKWNVENSIKIEPAGRNCPLCVACIKLGKMFFIKILKEEEFI